MAKKPPLLHTQVEGSFLCSCSTTLEKLTQTDFFGSSVACVKCAMSVGGGVVYQCPVGKLPYCVNCAEKSGQPKSVGSSKVKAMGKLKSLVRAAVGDAPNDSMEERKESDDITVVCAEVGVGQSADRIANQMDAAILKSEITTEMATAKTAATEKAKTVETEMKKKYSIRNEALEKTSAKAMTVASDTVAGTIVSAEAGIGELKEDMAHMSADSVLQSETTTEKATVATATCEAKDTSKKKKKKKTKKLCVICQKSYPIKDWAQHCQGKKHKRKSEQRIRREHLKARILSGDLESEKMRVCLICDRLTDTPKIWAKHCKGKRHQKAEARMRAPGERKANSGSFEECFDTMDETMRGQPVDEHCADCGLLSDSKRDKAMAVVRDTVGDAPNDLMEERKESDIDTVVCAEVGIGQSADRVANLMDGAILKSEITITEMATVKTAAATKATRMTEEAMSQETVAQKKTCRDRVAQRCEGKAQSYETKRCYSCHLTVPNSEWLDHCFTEAHYSKLSESQKSKVMDKRCFVCSDNPFFHTLGQWIRHGISETHKRAFARPIADRKNSSPARARIDQKSKRWVQRSSVAHSMTTKTVPTIRCPVCDTEFFDRRLFATHLKSSEHRAAARECFWCKPCGLILSNTGRAKRNHIASAEHLSNEKNNRQCGECHRAVLKSQWERHCRSMEHMHWASQSTQKKKKKCSEAIRATVETRVDISRRNEVCSRFVLPKMRYAKTCTWKKVVETCSTTPKKAVKRRTPLSIAKATAARIEDNHIHAVSVRSAVEEVKSESVQIEEETIHAKNAKLAAFSGLSKDELTVKVTEKVASHKVGDDSTAIAKLMLASMSLAQLFDFVLADESEAKRVIEEITDENAIERAKKKKAADKTKMERLEFYELTKKEERSRLAAKIKATVPTSGLRPEEIADRMQETMRSVQLFDFVSADIRNAALAIGKVTDAMKGEASERQWQCEADDDTYQKAWDFLNNALNEMAIGSRKEYTSYSQRYVCQRETTGEALQFNKSNENTRHLRLILLTKEPTAKRIVWRRVAASASAAATGKEVPAMDAQILMEKCTLGVSFVDSDGVYKYKKTATDTVVRCQMSSGKEEVFTRTLLTDPSSALFSLRTADLNLFAEKCKKRKAEEMDEKLLAFCRLTKKEKRKRVVAKIKRGLPKCDARQWQAITKRMLSSVESTELFEFVTADSCKAMSAIRKMRRAMKHESYEDQWQFHGDYGGYEHLSDDANTKLCNAKVGELIFYSVVVFKQLFDYKCVKTSVGEAVQCNLEYGKPRHLRQILVTKGKAVKQRIVWRSLASASVAAIGSTETPPMEEQIAMQKCAVGASRVGTTSIYKYKKTASDKVTRTEVATGKKTKFKRELVDDMFAPDPSQNSASVKMPIIAFTKIGPIDSLYSLEKVKRTFEKAMNAYYKNHTDCDVHVVDIRLQKESKNMVRWRKFWTQSASFKKQLLVFHGTASDSVAKIAANGFNHDYTTDHWFGKGVYFGVTPTVAHEYTTPDASGVRYMFACVIGITKMEVGARTMDKAPTSSDGVTLVDTLVDRATDPSQFVAMRDDLAVALWLIRYTTPGDNFHRDNIDYRRDKFGGFN